MRGRSLLPHLSLVLLALLAYANSINNGFLYWDDSAYVFDNIYIREITVENIRHLLTDLYIGEWFPLQMLSFLLDYQVWGLDVFGYHLTNLLFHAGAVILLFLILETLGYKRNEAFIAGALFAVFPPSVEAIAWVSQRKSVMCMFFMLLSFYLYIRGYLFYSIIFFALSLLSKITSFPFPGIILFYEMLCKNNLKRGSFSAGLKRTIPYLFLSIFFFIIFFYGQREERIIVNYGTDAIKQSLLLFLTSPFYGFISKIFLPVNLNPFYPPQGYGTITHPHILLSILLWVFVLLPLILFSLKNKLRLFWLIYCLLIVLPIITMVAFAIKTDATGTSPGGADRHLYFVYPAVAGYLSCGLDSLIKSRRIFTPLLLLLLSSYILLTIQRNYIWRSDLSLWTDAIEKTPDYFFTQLKAGDVNLKEFYKTNQEHYLESAIRHLKRTIELNPQIARAHYMLAEALERAMDYEGALNHYEESMRWAKNESPLPLQSIGRIYYKLKRYRDAIESYNRALKIDPESYILWNEKGSIELKAGFYDEAISSFKISLSLRYSQYDVHRKLGAIYLKIKGDKASALHHFEESFRENPAQEDADMLIKIIQALREQVNR